MAFGRMGARGGFGSFGVLGKAGTPAPQILPLWNAALTARAAGTKNATLLFLGDSTTAGWGGQGTAAQTNSSRWSVPRRFVPYLPYGSNSSFFGDYNSLIGAGSIGLGTFDNRIALGGWTQSLSNTPTLGGRMLTNSSSTTAATFTPLYAVDSFDIYTRRGAGLGSFTAQIDAGGLTTIDQSVGSGVVKTTVTAALGNHVLKLAWVSGSCDLLGVVAYNSAQKECTIINGGFAGSKVSDWTPNVNAYDPLSMVATVAPDLTIINLTINDWVAATNTTTYTSGLQAIITACKVTGDVILMSGAPSQTTSASSAQQAIYRSIVQSLATSNGLQYLDLTAQWTDWVTANGNGWMYDSLHPNGTGYALIPDLIASTMQLSRSYTSEAQSIFSSFTTPPTAARKRTISWTTEQLKASTIWTDIDALNVMAAADSQAALPNWKSPGTFDLIPVSAPTFAANQGFTSAGVGSILRTQYTPSVNGVKYALNDAAIWNYCLSGANQASASGADAGTTTGTGLVLLVTANNTGSSTLRINDATNTAVASPGASGMYGGQRTSTTAKKIFRNGSSITTASVASTALPALEVYVLGANSSVTGSHQSAIHAIGASLNGKELAFSNIMTLYLQEVGAVAIS